MDAGAPVRHDQFQPFDHIHGRKPEDRGDTAQVGQTPQGWNGSIFGLIRNLSDSVIMPIAGMIITFVLCYELITMLTEKNWCGIKKVDNLFSRTS